MKSKTRFSGVLKPHKRPADAPEAEYRAEPAARPGRPPGKRSDPDFEQVTAYIKRKTYVGVKIELLKESQDQEKGQGREFSDLLEELLTDWLKSRS
jgi:hypothetical protein